MKASRMRVEQGYLLVPPSVNEFINLLSCSGRYTSVQSSGFIYGVKSDLVSLFSFIKDTQKA